MKKYSFEDFQKEFPNEDSCLEYIVRIRFPNQELRRIKGRKAYTTQDRRHIYPLKGTIFERSSTSLMKWFYAIYLFSQSKNGVAAKELERQLGVTYKTAWRMAKAIRGLMKEGDIKLSGVVEADEAYIGGRRPRRSGSYFKDKAPIVGVVQRGGQLRGKVISRRDEYEIIPFLQKYIRKGSILVTDDAAIYNVVRGYKKQTINHSQKQYVLGDVYTNTIENFWGQLKRSLHGTHHSVSKKHLQSYVDEFVYRYNRKNVPQPDQLRALLGRIDPPKQL